MIDSQLHTLAVDDMVDIPSVISAFLGRDIELPKPIGDKSFLELYGPPPSKSSGGVDHESDGTIVALLVHVRVCGCMCGVVVLCDWFLCVCVCVCVLSLIHI